MTKHRSHPFASRTSLASVLLLLALVGAPVRADDRCLFPRDKAACLDLARTSPGVDCYWCSKGGVGMCVREGERAGAAQLQMACEGKAAAAASSGNTAVATKPAAGTSPTTTTTNANPRPTATATTSTANSNNPKPNNLYTPAVQSFVQSNEKFTRTIASGGSVQVRACNNVDTHTCCIQPSQWTSNTCMATLGDDPCEELFGTGSRSCSVGKLSKCKGASCQLRCGASCGVFPFVERPGSSGTTSTTTAATPTTANSSNNNGIQGPVATKTQNGVIITVKKNP